MDTDLNTVMQRVDALVDEYRARCLWYLREDYYPATAVEAIRVLEAIEKNADLAGFKRTAALRQWLSQHINEISA